MPQGRSGDSGRAYEMFGKIGYIAKGIAIGVIGVLFLYAAVDHSAKKSGGLDQALHKVLAPAVRSGAAVRDLGRDRLLRALLLRPGPPPQRATLSRQRRKHAIG